MFWFFTKAKAESVAHTQSVNCGNWFWYRIYASRRIDLKSGFTTPDIEEASVKEAAIKTSYMPFILADHTKFRRVFSVTFAQLRQCCIITDALPDSKYSSETVIKEVKI